MRGAVIVLAIANVVAAAIVVYFSPHQSCVRNTDARTVDDPDFRCAVASGEAVKGARACYGCGGSGRRGIFDGDAILLIQEITAALPPPSEDGS